MFNELAHFIQNENWVIQTFLIVLVTMILSYLEMRAYKRIGKKFEATKNQHVAVLHDAISDLLSAIYKHDNDLTPSKVENDDSM